MLTDTQLKSLKPQEKAYKVADALGLYVTVATSGTKSFRYDYRVDGKRETLTVGRYEEGTPSRATDELDTLDFGAVVSLADARALHDRARRMVKGGVSPSKAKVEKRTVTADEQTFGTWADKFFEFKADPKSGGEQLADSTLALRKSIYRRLLEKPLGKKNLDDIKPKALAELFDKANQFYQLQKYLSNDDFKHFSNERAKIKGTLAGQGGPADLNSEFIRQTLNTRLQTLRIDPTPSDFNTSEVARVGAIRQFVDQYFLAAQRSANRKFTDAEIIGHIDGLFLNNQEFKGMFSNSQKPMMSLKVGDLPSDVRLQLLDAFGRQGVTNPSDAQILNAYWNYKVVRR